MDEIAKARFFDETASNYDEDSFHVTVADALVDGLPSGPGLVLDVATGTGFAAFAALRLGAVQVLAVDHSAAMIERARAKAPELDPDGRITWQVGPALPMPAADHSADVVLCASSYHFLGPAALPDWLRVLRPGGRLAFSMPSSARFRASPAFAAVIPADLVLPADETEAAAMVSAAGFVDVVAGRAEGGGDRPRSVLTVHATAP